MRTVCVAPMMDRTDRHFRRLIRSITKNTVLYTEMLTASAVVHGNRELLLDYSLLEHPIALQLGGSDPMLLTEAATIAQDWGYDEVNLNVGCPSARVQSGRFGACLMKEPDRVAECLARMQSALTISVTVKTRIGVDNQDRYSDLCWFIEAIREAGCKTVILHARKAWLKGLSPKENRTIPPLNYERVYQLKQDYPELEIIINGGINSLEMIQQHLAQVDGTMLGRQAYTNPYLFSTIDQKFYGSSDPVRTRQQVVRDYIPYIFEQHAKGVSLRCLTRHLAGVFHGVAGAKRWRCYLSENMESLKQAHIFTNMLSTIIE